MQVVLSTGRNVVAVYEELRRLRKRRDHLRRHEFPKWVEAQSVLRERVFTGTYRQAADTFDLRIHDRANRKPIYFRVVPGSTSDKAMFETCLDKIGGRDFTVILNKGFFSEKNIRLMTGMEFIFDLKMKLHIIYVS